MVWWDLILRPYLYPVTILYCQHGLESLPKNTLVPGHWVGMVDIAGKPVERGFITFSPHNPCRRGDRFRYLDRKANAIGLTFYSIIIAHHEQILNWLAAHPKVDAEKIGFYGISYGGANAMFAPSVLTGYSLSICAANLNDWTRMMAGAENHGYMYTDDQWEMPYFNMGPTFSHAEMAYLIAPRPFMVERGHHDSVGHDCQVAIEHTKIRWLYAQLGISEHAEIEFFREDIVSTAWAPSIFWRNTLGDPLHRFIRNKDFDLHIFMPQST